MKQEVLDNLKVIQINAYALMDIMIIMWMFVFLVIIHGRKKLLI